MDNLLAARSQMAMSLGFHIVFAALGIAMPLLMVIAELRWLRTGDDVFLTLTKRWAKGTAILFAVGAVSGTVLSFELGLLWPHFMGWAGAIIGMPFSLEGFAFFTESIFLGIYLYGWQRVSPRAHIASGALVAISGAASGVFVVIANAWMNTPTGFNLIKGTPHEIDPIAAMLNPSALPQAVHMILAAYAAAGFAVAGVHALMILRRPKNALHRHAFRIALAVGGIAAVLQPFSGDLLAQAVAHYQPVKLAALEGQFKTERSAPARIGGLPDVDAHTTRYAIEIPYGLSLLAFHSTQATVRGLDSFPQENWPPVPIVHVAFQIMVGSGLLMIAVAVWAALLGRRLREPANLRGFLRIIVAAAPLGFIAIETGWIVTEVGRQPWIIHGVMRTSEAVTPMPGLVVPFLTFTLLYIFLAMIVIWLMRAEIRTQ